jgi:hypothetical protein
MIKRWPTMPTLSRFLLPFILCVGWIAISLLINPIGDFPLNDDWSYGLPVQNFVHDGSLHFTNWQAPTLIGQALWGADFCLPYGFSFTALRISTVVIGLIGVLSIYGCLREFNAPRTMAFAAALVFGLNPIYLGLSYSFMTDVPFAAAFAASLYFLVRGLSKNRNTYLVIGLSIAWYSIFIRQFGFALFLGFAAASLTSWGPTWRWVKWAVLPIIVAALSLAAYSAALKVTGRMPHLYGAKSAGAVIVDLLHLRLGAMKVPLRSTSIALMYLGFFTLPFQALVAPLALRRLSQLIQRWLIGLGLATVVVVTLLLTHLNWLMPLTGNIVLNFGLGIRDAVGTAPHGVSKTFWIAITASAALGLYGLIVLASISLMESIAQWRRGRKVDASISLQVLLIVTLLAYFFPLATMYEMLFDRYFLPMLVVIPALLFGASASTKVPKTAWAFFIVTICMTGYFSIAATHDLMDWNRARAVAFNELADLPDTNYEKIDGGFALNNLFPNRAAIKTGGVDGLVDRSKAKYFICQSIPAGYTPVRQIDCHPWLPCAIDTLWVAVRDEQHQ